MPEFPDTTSGIVETNGYPGLNGTPTTPYDPQHPLDEAFGYYAFKDANGVRIGTGLRFWSGYPDRTQPARVAFHWFYDFFSASVWPTEFWSTNVAQVLPAEAGPRVPAGQSLVAHTYDDPVNAHSGLAAPQTIFRAYRISHPDQPGAPNVGWLFVQGPPPGEITIAVVASLIDNGRPFHMGVSRCHFLHTVQATYDLTGLWGQVLPPGKDPR